MNSTAFPEANSPAEPLRPRPRTFGPALTSSATSSPLVDSLAPSQQLREPQSWETKGDELGVEALQVAERVREAIDEVVERAKQTADHVKDRYDDIRARLESGQLQQEVRERATQFADITGQQVREARRRVETYSRKYPLKFIAGVALVGFAVGFLLRIGRDE